MVVDIHAELDESSVPDVRQYEESIVSRSRDILSDVEQTARDRVNELVRPLGYQVKLLHLERNESIVLYVACFTSSVVVSLRDQWKTGQLKDNIQSLFNFIAGDNTPTALIKRLTWSDSDYTRCMAFFEARGKNSRIFFVLF